MQDPFDALGPSQIDRLRELAVSRQLARRLGTRSAAVQQRDGELTALLLEDGIDADAMLARREALIAERKARAETLVDAVDGQPLAVSGFLVPLALQDGRVREFLLVPWAGACSHAPPPPPNQLLHVVAPAEGLDPALEQRRVRVEGTLRVSPRIHRVTMIDGVVAVASGYAVEPARVGVASRPAAAALDGR